MCLFFPVLNLNLVDVLVVLDVVDVDLEVEVLKHSLSSLQLTPPLLGQVVRQGYTVVAPAWTT